MHIETSADARQSRRHAAGGGLAGPAADDRGYLAAAASRLSLWWRGTSRPQALTADTASGAGLQGGNDDAVPSSDGGAATAPLEGGSPPTTSDLDDRYIPLQHATEHDRLYPAHWCGVGLAPTNFWLDTHLVLTGARDRFLR